MAGNGTGSMAARSEAVRALIENHPEEFEGYLGDAREARGLSRVPGDNAAEVRKRKIEKHLAALKELGIEVQAVAHHD